MSSLVDFSCLRGRGGGEWVLKNSFSDVEWSSKKLWKMISADVYIKANVKQYGIKSTFETWNAMDKGHVFFI